jgi:hypothetical protein
VSSVARVVCPDCETAQRANLWAASPGTTDV